MTALLLPACAVEDFIDLGTSRRAEPAPELDISRDEGPPPPSLLADMVEEVLPTVVNVRVRSVSFDPLGEAQIGSGQGSGVIIDPSGFVITNNHVISGAAEVEVVAVDGETYEGTVIGTDPENDIAVIAIDSDEELPAIEIGKSSELRLGDEVVAIGFPLGLGGPTVTRGIVSAEDRTILIGETSPNLPDRLRGLLQTDAAINPGNSGGALVDAAGRLIAINTAAARAGAAENVGFAIPIDTALPIALEVIEDPPEKRSYIGVSIRDLSPAVASQLDIDPALEGALIAGLFPDGPAEEAGLEVGDVIVSIEERAITDVGGLNEVLRDFEPGETVVVTVVRDGESLDVDVELAQRPTTFD